MRSNNVKPPLVAIIGPTASGKTDLAFKLAKTFNGAVISADSQQLYKHATIGTNQPKGIWRQANKKQQKVMKVKKIYYANGIPNFFIDFLSPNQLYSAAKFQADTQKLCSQLTKLGYLPILTGGTMLYISAVVEGYIFPPGLPNTKLRKSLEKLNNQQLSTKLKKLDIASWQSIDILNRRRLIRAIEYVMLSGKSFVLQKQQVERPNTLIIGLKTNKNKLRAVIAKRTKQMLKRGLINEVKYLLKYYPKSPLLTSIGYRSTVLYLKKQISLPELEQQINNQTWQYTKRQMSWFKKIPNVFWLNSPAHALKIVKEFLHTSSLVAS